jgi:hypothetical protein
VSFQVGPAGLADKGLCGAAFEAEKMTARGEAEFCVIPDHRCALCREVAEQPWEQLVEDLRAPWYQQMGVPALRDALPVRRHLRERVAFHDRHSLVFIGQHSGGEEAGHAGPENHRLAGDLFHLTTPAS